MGAVVQGLDFGLVCGNEIIVVTGVVVLDDQRLLCGIGGVGREVLPQHGQRDIQARIDVGSALMSGVACRVAAIQRTTKLIVVLIRVVGEQAAAAASRFGHALCPLHRDITASIVTCL